MYWQGILPQYPQSTPQAYKDAVHIILYSVFIVHVRNIFLSCLRIDFRGDLEGPKKRRQRTSLPLGLFPVSPDEFCHMQLQHFKRSVLEARILLSVWSKKPVTPEASRSSPAGQSYERSFLKDIRMNKLNWEYSVFQGVGLCPETTFTQDETVKVPVILVGTKSKHLQFRKYLCSTMEGF